MDAIEKKYIKMVKKCLPLRTDNRKEIINIIQKGIHDYILDYQITDYNSLIHYHQLCWWFDFCPIRAHTCAPRRRCLKQLCHQTSKRGPIGYLLSSTLPSVPVCISSLLLP